MDYHDIQSITEGTGPNSGGGGGDFKKVPLGENKQKL